MPRRGRVNASQRAPRRRFRDGTVQSVWDRADHRTGRNPDTGRRDAAGYSISRHTTGGRGRRWDVDHRNPVARGGNNNHSNLQALGRTRNRRRGDQTWSRWVNDNGRRSSR